MEFALYDSESGYYARAAQRSGRAGDFFTSVDVGPVFGELLAVQIVEMLGMVQSQSPNPESRPDLVEAGAGNGRLSNDIVRSIRTRDRELYGRLRLHLVEASAGAREAQRDVLGDVGETLASSSPELPASFTGVLIANELLDALPTHQVVMRDDGLREVYVDVDRDRLGTGDWRLVTTEGAPSTPALAEYLARLSVVLEPGWRAEINLRAVDWIREAVRRLQRGFLILIDYGHPAHELYSVTHATGTLTTFTRHTMAGPERPGAEPAWLERPGEQDITAHVDFTGIQRAAEDEGAVTLGLLDQTYFLLGLGAAGMEGADLKTRLALKTLLMPGGLGSTLKVLILGKNAGAPALRGCAFRMRLT